jgi:hypothetical protein
MKRRVFIRNSLIISSGLVFDPLSVHGILSKTSSGIQTNIFSSKEKSVPVILLDGPPIKRGHIHGETLRSKITELIQVWKDELKRQNMMDPDKYINEFLENTNFPKAIKKWTPGLLGEVKGIAEGAGIEYETMLAYQLVDEEWWYGSHKRSGIPIPDAKNCSALGVYGQEGIPSLVAQNLDIPAFTDGYQALLHIRYPDSPLEAYVFTYAGLISGCGLNNFGIAEVVNALLQLDHRVDGLPVAFVNRGILEKTSLSDAVHFIKNIKHASGQNYTIGGPEKVVAFECSANKVSPFVPYNGSKRIYHTNHPLANDDQEIYKTFQKKYPRRAGAKGPGDSEIRYMALEKRLKDPNKRITVDSVKEALSSRDHPVSPVCRKKRKDGRGSFTAGCVIMELSLPPVLHFAPGPACTTDFLEFRFKD